VIKVNNQLKPWETVRNFVFASFNGDKRTINNVLLGLGVFVVLVLAALFGRKQWHQRIRTNLR
jgi:hypothetical protein